MVVLQILVFALSLVMLYSLPSDLVCMYTASVEVPKACLRMGEEKMPKSVGASTWASDLQEDVEKPIPANQVKCLG